MKTILQYTGYRASGGGVLAVIRALAAQKRFHTVLGVSRDFPGGIGSGEEQWRGPAVEGESISPGNIFAARRVAREVRTWLNADAGRIFHGHSRAGLLVALWLHRWGERRVVVSVHCYGRRRWFYRWAARQLGSRLFWLSPAMKKHYGLTVEDWAQCIPGGVPEDYARLTPAEPMADRLRFGGAGALVRWKRWDLLVDALALLPPSVRSQISFEHIGTAPAEADAQAFAAELQRRTPAQVRWSGAEASSHRLLQAIDVFVTVSHQEPFSMAMQEALAAGVPVLAAESGGATDLIVPGENGWLFREGDAPALAGLLEKLVQARAWSTLDRTKIRRSAHRAAEVAARWEEIYAKL